MSTKSSSFLLSSTRFSSSFHPLLQSNRQWLASLPLFWFKTGYYRYVSNKRPSYRGRLLEYGRLIERGVYKIITGKRGAFIGDGRLKERGRLLEKIWYTGVCITVSVTDVKVTNWHKSYSKEANNIYTVIISSIFCNTTICSILLYPALNICSIHKSQKFLL